MPAKQCQDVGMSVRTIHHNVTPNRQIISSFEHQCNLNNGCRAELDSHADTCAVNNIARIIEYTGGVAEVSGFSPSLETLTNIPIVKAAVAYNDPNTGLTTIVILNQVLYLICFSTPIKCKHMELL